MSVPCSPALPSTQVWLWVCRSPPCLGFCGEGALILTKFLLSLQKEEPAG